MSSPVERFEMELGLLRDQVIRASRDDNLGDLKDGLDLYTTLIVTVLKEFRRYENAVEGPRPSSIGDYGPEMSWLDDDMQAIMRVASTHVGTETLRAVLAFLHNITLEALDHDELPAFASFLGTYRVAWNAAKRDDRPEKWRRIRQSILTTMESLGSYRLGPLLRSPASVGRALPFASHLVAQVVLLVKAAVDDHDTDDLELATRTLVRTMRFSQDVAPDPSPSLEPAHLSIPVLKAAGLLGIEAWILLRNDMGRTNDTEALALLRALQESSSQAGWSTTLGWSAYLVAIDRRPRSTGTARSLTAGDLFGWTWWETALWEEEGGFLRFQAFLDLAFAKQLLARRAWIPDVRPSTELRHDAERLLEAIDEIMGDPLTPTILSGPVPGGVEPVRQRLADIRNQVTRDEDDELTSRDLEPQLVDEFRAGVLRERAESRHLRSLCRELRVDFPEESEREDDGGVAPPAGFGANSLVPKDYFVTQDAVFADPGDLGREYGEALERGEDALIVARLRENLPEISTTGRELAAVVKGVVDDLIAQGHEPVVVAFNSWILTEALRDELGLDPDGAPVTEGLKKAPRLRGTNVPVLLRYTPDGAFCVVADFRASVAIRNAPVEPERPGDTVEDDDRLLIGVEKIDQERARAMIDANQRLRQTAELEEMTDEAAIRQLTKQVHVRVVEWISVEVLDTRTGSIIDVENLDSS